MRALTDYLKYLDKDVIAYHSMLSWRNEYEMYQRFKDIASSISNILTTKSNNLEEFLNRCAQPKPLSSQFM